MTTPNSTRPLSAHRRLAIAGLMAALAAAPAIASPGAGCGHGPDGQGMRMGMGGHGMAMGAPGAGMGGMPGMGPMSPQRLERLLDGIEATPAQREQLRGILDAARGDMQSSAQSGRQLAEEAARLFREPTIDAAAVEALRLRMLAQHDRATQRMMQVLVDAGRVLDVEQRRQLADRMADHRSMTGAHAARHGWR